MMMGVLHALIVYLILQFSMNYVRWSGKRTPIKINLQEFDVDFSDISKAVYIADKYMKDEHEAVFNDFMLNTYLSKGGLVEDAVVECFWLS